MNSIHHLISAVINAAAARLVRDTPVHRFPQWSGLHTNPTRAERRRMLRAFGRRQFKKRGMHKLLPARPLPVARVEGA